MKSIRQCVKEHGDSWKLYAPEAFKYSEYKSDNVDYYVMTSVAKRAYMLKLDANVTRFK